MCTYTKKNNIADRSVRIVNMRCLTLSKMFDVEASVAQRFLLVNQFLPYVFQRCKFYARIEISGYYQ